MAKPPRLRLLAVVVQRQVLGQRELEHEAAAVTVLGDVADAGVDASPWHWRGEMSCPATVIVPAVGRRSPVIASISSALAVPLDAGDAHDLAGAHRARPRTPRARGRRHLRGRRLGTGRTGCARLLGDAEQHLAGDGSARLSLGGPLARDGAAACAVPQHGDRSATASTSCSLCVTG